MKFSIKSWKKIPYSNALSFYFSILFTSVQFIIIHFSTMWFIGMAVENEMPKHQDKRSTFSLFLSVSAGLIRSEMKAYSHTHSHTCTHTLSLSIFPSPNVSLTPQGVWLSRLGGMDLSLLIRLLNHLSLFQWPSSPHSGFSTLCMQRFPYLYRQDLGLERNASQVKSIS